jgi:hypothetical protein
MSVIVSISRPRSASVCQGEASRARSGSASPSRSAMRRQISASLPSDNEDRAEHGDARPGVEGGTRGQDSAQQAVEGRIGREAQRRAVGYHRCRRGQLAGRIGDECEHNQPLSTRPTTTRRSRNGREAGFIAALVTTAPARSGGVAVKRSTASATFSGVIANLLGHQSSNVAR